MGCARSVEAKREAPPRVAQRAGVRGVLLALLVLGATCLPSVARADGGEGEARATKLFEEGRALARDGRCSDAIPLFLESVKYAAGVGPLLNLGHCYEQAGKTASAYRYFERAGNVARERKDPRAAEAEERARVLEPKLSTLNVRVIDPEEPGLELRLDEPLERVRWGAATRVDPGPHVLVATSPRHGSVTLRVAVGDRSDRAEVVVSPLAPAATTTEPRPSRGKQRVLGYSVGGVGVAGVALGAVFGALSASDHGSLVDQCATYPTCAASQRGELDDLNDRARTRGTVATISLVAGLALVAGGAAIVLLAPREH